MDFKDLARSGTAPEPAKLKSSSIHHGDGNINNYSLLTSRPKTRSVDNDVNDFNIDLRSLNKITNFALNSDTKKNLSEENKVFKRLQEEEEYLKAIENFQAAVEDWSGRKDMDGFVNNRQQTASSNIRPSKQQHEATKPPSNIASAYTQNVPNIILQTSKRSTESNITRPQTTSRNRELKSISQQSHNNHISDIRAAYGAELSTKEFFSYVKPKPSSAMNTNRRNIDISRNSDDANHIYESTATNSSDTMKAIEDTITNSKLLSSAPPNSKRPLSDRRTHKSSSPVAVPQNNTYNKIANNHTASASTAASSQDRKTISSREVDVDGGYNSNNSNNNNNYLSSNNKPASGRKSSSGANKLLKASLVNNRKSIEKNRNNETYNADNEVDFSIPNKKKIDSISDDANQFIPIPQSITALELANDNYNIMYEASNIAELSTSTVTKVTNHTIQSNNKYASSIPVAGHQTSKELNIIPPFSSNIPDNQNMRLSRGPSSSPIMLLAGSSSGDTELNKSESEIIFVEVEDSDGLEGSFDDSPILAEYLRKQEQLKTTITTEENSSTHTIKNNTTGSSTDNIGMIARPQSRKLYLGGTKEPPIKGESSIATTSTDTSFVKTTKNTQPRSAGTFHSSRKVVVATTTAASNENDNSEISSSNMFEIPKLSKMNSYNDIFSSVNNKNNNETISFNRKVPSPEVDDKNQRPPSRQSSAFPTHLTSSSSSSSKKESPVVERNRNEFETNKVSDNNYKNISIPYQDNEVLHDKEQFELLKPTDQINLLNSNRINTKENKVTPTTVVKSIKDSLDSSRYEQPELYSSHVKAAVDNEEPLISSPNHSYNNRPPSRQKIAAQHLFEGQQPPPTRGDTSSSNSISSNNRWTARTATAAGLNYNPQQDGFLDIVDSRGLHVTAENDLDLPFKIKVNYGTNSSNTSLLRRSAVDGDKQYQQQRVQSNNNNIDNGSQPKVLPKFSNRNYDNYIDSNIEATTTMEQQIDLNKPRSKTATGGLKSNRGDGSYFHENNNHNDSQWDIIPSSQRTRESKSSSGSLYSGSKLQLNNNPTGSYNNYNTTVHTNNNNSSNRWADVDNDITNPRSRIFIKRNTSASSTTTPKKKSDDLYRFRRNSDDEEDDIDDEDDEQSIMTDDSGMHVMESMMSMHSITLDSSLGEDFLSLFAPA